MEDKKPYHYNKHAKSTLDDGFTIIELIYLFQYDSMVFVWTPVTGFRNVLSGLLSDGQPLQVV